MVGLKMAFLDSTSFLLGQIAEDLAQLRTQAPVQVFPCGTS
jgi:hypothetical protein